MFTANDQEVYLRQLTDAKTELLGWKSELEFYQFRGDYSMVLSLEEILKNSLTDFVYEIEVCLAYAQHHNTDFYIAIHHSIDRLREFVDVMNHYLSEPVEPRF